MEVLMKDVLIALMCFIFIMSPAVATFVFMSKLTKAEDDEDLSGAIKDVSGIIVVCSGVMVASLLAMCFLGGN
jgi:hypothetical protein